MTFHHTYDLAGFEPGILICSVHTLRRKQCTVKAGLTNLHISEFYFISTNRSKKGGPDSNPAPSHVGLSFHSTTACQFFRAVCTVFMYTAIQSKFGVWKISEQNFIPFIHMLTCGTFFKLILKSFFSLALETLHTWLLNYISDWYQRSTLFSSDIFDTVEYVKLSSDARFQHFQRYVSNKPWRRGQVVSSPPSREEIESLGREIKTRHGIGW
jgi:hypothetical protein